MWLQLSQIKKINSPKREKTSIYLFTMTSQKSEKNTRGQTLRASPRVRMRTVAENLAES